MNFGDLILSCSSPEQFLKVRNGTVETRPVKGTCPINDNPESLRTSPKNRAENIMIVDLLRNDLSKVCTPESIDVTRLCEVETYAGLHHLVSEITGKLESGKDGLDALQACFPGGSITGAPKIRAMEIITELEGRPRGPYCGSLGYIGFDGAMDTNIAIRTLIYQNGKIRFNTGGGIVANSDPESEYRETLLKSSKIFESFGS
jgi:para-aminobenzoate synthetase component 1